MFPMISSTNHLPCWSTVLSLIGEDEPRRRVGELGDAGFLTKPADFDL
jgi:hypothetical protein